MSCERFLEFPARSAQSRIDGVDVHPEESGDLGNGHSLELDENEHLATVVVECVENPVQERGGFALLALLLRAWAALLRHLVRVRSGPRALTSNAKSVVACNPDHDSVHPA